MLITWLENVNVIQLVFNIFFYLVSKLSSTKWQHKKGSGIPRCKNTNGNNGNKNITAITFPLNLSQQQNSMKYSRGKQLRQDVKIFPIFRVCLWLVESTETVCKKVHGRKQRHKSVRANGSVT
jgi:hypothetical protein